jgi:hypothetical protein
MLLQNIGDVTKSSYPLVCILEKITTIMQEKTLALLRQDILTYWEDLKEGDFEDNGFLKELNACIGYYNEYKRGQVVKATEE